MNLLTPIYLGFLALALPIILLFIIKPRRRRVLLPSLHIWERMARAREARDLLRKLKRLLSLLLHLLVLAGLAFALARPFFSERLVPQRIILVLDTTTSMLAEDGGATGSERDAKGRRRTRFEDAREYARKLAGDLSPEDRMTIVEAGAQPRVLLPFTSDRGRLRDALDAMEARPAASNLRAGLDLGLALARQLEAKRREVKEEDKEAFWTRREAESETLLVLVSDGTDTTIKRGITDDASTEPRLPLPERTKFHYVPVGTGKNDNVSISAFAVRELLNSPGDHEVLATAHNHSAHELLVRPELFLDGEIHDSLPEILMPAGATVRLPVSETSAPRGGGILELRLSVTAVDGEPIRRDDAEAPSGATAFRDLLPVDDHAFAAVPRVQRKRVLLVSATPNLFIEAALAQDPGVEAEKLPATGWPPKDADQYDVVIFDRFLPPELPDTDLMFFAVRGPLAPVAGDGVQTAPSLRDYERDHPVMRYVQLENVSFLKAQRLIQPGSRRWRTLAQSWRGPLLLAGDLPERRIVYAGFNPTDTDLVLRKSWPILISNTIDWLVERRRARRRIPAFRVGEVATLELSPEERAALAAAKDEGPFGGETGLAVWPPEDKARVVPVHDGRISWAGTHRVGVYRLATTSVRRPDLRAPADARAFTVNLLDPAEGELAVADTLGLGEQTIDRFTAGFEWELRDSLLLAALILLLIETVLFHLLMVF